MPSQYEDTNVDDLDVANLSEEQLRDILENDSRVTAQEKAQVELNRREAEANADDTSTTKDTPQEGVSMVEAPSGEKVPVEPAKEEASTLRTATGEPYSALSEDAGALQVQHEMDEAQLSGTFPGTGGPPAGDHTVSAVTGDYSLQNAAEKASSDKPES